MKHDDIQRSVRSSRNERAAGDAPSLGRMARMPGAGLPKGSRRQRKRSEGGRGSRPRQARKTIVVIWSVLLLGAVLAVLIAAVMMWVLPKIREGKYVPKVATTEEVAETLAKFPVPSEDDALAIVRQGLAQRNPEKVAQFFRLGASSPLEVSEFLAGLETLDGGLRTLEWIGSIDANGLSIEAVLINFKGLSDAKRRNRVALLVPEEEGKWKIDFEAFARVVSPSWDKISGNAAAAQVRVFVAKDSYYNGPFGDEEAWICYGLASPDTEDILLGYCRVGSAQAAALDWMFSKESALVRATLEIRRVEGGGGRQFEITQVIAEDWVRGAAPFDERFK